MLEKYLKFLIRHDKGETDTDTGKSPSPPASEEWALGDVIQPIDESRPAAPVDAAIDTGEISADSNFTHILPIDTHGAKNNAGQLLLRFIGRQPVLDQHQQVVGYDLLLRARNPGTPRSADETLLRMQDEMLIHSIAALQIEHLLGDKLAFIGLSSYMINSPSLDLLPPEGVVLAFHPLPEHAVAMMDNLKPLVASGRQIALDDFLYTPQFEPLLRMSRYVRIDITRFDALQLSAHIAQIRKHTKALVIAKNVQTEEDFEVCRKLGVDYFQGYYFIQMRPAEPPKIGSDRMRVMELLNRVTSHAEISELEEIFKRDATLSYKLLRFINSPACGLPQKLRSIAHALVMLGHDQLYRWLTLLLFTSGKLDLRSQALLKNALIRARLTEILGRKKLPPMQQEGLFIVGIFSLLDVLLNTPMEQALAQLNLPDSVMHALIQREGIYARYLQLAIACEQPDQDNIAEHAKLCGFTEDEVNLAHITAIVWAEDIDKE